MVYRYSKAPSSRQLKVAQEIRHALAEILMRNELSHPFFEKLMITVSEVRISSDMKMATAFIILPDESEKKSILKFFNEIAPAFRKLVVKKVQLKFAPEIKFAIDESVNRVAEMEKLFKKITPRN